MKTMRDLLPKSDYFIENTARYGLDEPERAVKRFIVERRKTFGGVEK